MDTLDRQSSLEIGWHPEGMRVDLDGGEYAYVIDRGGTGVPVVLLHGIMVSSWTWRFTLEGLYPEYRPVAVCHRGFGWSDKPTGHYDVPVLTGFITRVLDRLGIGRAHIVGNSLGGAVALRMALDSPYRVASLTLLAPAAVRFRHVSWFLKLQRRRFGPLYDLAGHREVYRRFLQLMAYAGRPVDDETMDHFMAPLVCGRAVRAAATLSQYLPRDARTLLSQAPRVHQPTLLCWGTRDGLVPFATSRPLAKRLPNVGLQVYRGVGHCPMEERPDEFLRHLLAHLRAHS